MSEYQGNYDSVEPQSYPFTGSAPQMDPEDYFSLNPIPDGVKPIIDPETRMCIGYEGIGSIGYDPTSGFFKYGFIYDINEKEVDQYKRKLTAEDVDAMSSEEAEEYHKFRRSVFDAEDHGMFGSSDDVWLMVATDAALENLPYAMRSARVMGKRKLLLAEREIANRAPEPYQQGRSIFKERRRRIKLAIAEGKPQGPPTKIQISTAVVAAPTTFVLKSKLKMGLAVVKLKFEDTALGHMSNPKRYIPEVILEHIIRNGVRLPDSSNRAFGLMYKTYVGIVYKNGTPRLVEVIVNERTWTIKHFHYSDADRIGNLNPKKGTWSGRINKWMEEYKTQTIYKKPYIEDKRIKRIEKNERKQLTKREIKEFKDYDIKAFKRQVEATKNIKYNSEGHPEWNWKKGE
ncbi:unnamed protein product [Commensalibacter communis]|uniref:hypothetical protein n=1 Tax=Commensalibacter communis TaxID=2972786 RepID=UPI0022FF7716|nr:hypothetical protein [Commensalibacter communis]CAI3959913.1 unnamed protein product [Commensalibacter communis]